MLRNKCPHNNGVTEVLAKLCVVITLQYIRISKNSLYTLSLLAPWYISTGGKKKNKTGHVTKKCGRQKFEESLGIKKGTVELGVIKDNVNTKSHIEFMNITVYLEGRVYRNE